MGSTVQDIGQYAATMLVIKGHHMTSWWKISCQASYLLFDIKSSIFKNQNWLCDVINRIKTGLLWENLCISHFICYTTDHLMFSHATTAVLLVPVQKIHGEILGLEVKRKLQIYKFSRDFRRAFPVIIEDYIWYSSKAHLKLKSFKISFTHNIHFSSTVELEFCIEHSSCTAFLHDRPWISLWIKSISNELDIIHAITSQ